MVNLKLIRLKKKPKIKENLVNNMWVNGIYTMN